MYTQGSFRAATRVNELKLHVVIRVDLKDNVRRKKEDTRYDSIYTKA